MNFGEYRESVDINFLVSDAMGYRKLRQLLTGLDGLAPITRAGAMPLAWVREVRADPYEKASEAYGAAITRDLAKAIDRLEAKPAWLERCMKVMTMDMPQAVLWQKNRHLRRALPPAQTQMLT